MNSKRIKSSLFLVFFLVLALALSGCNSQSNTESKPNDKSSQGNEGDGKEELKPYTLSLYYPGAPQKDQKKVEEEINKILQEEINASLEMHPVDFGAWSDRMTLMMTSGEAADIIFTAEWNGYAIDAGKGAFLPIDDLLKTHGQDIVNTLDPRFLEGAKIDGVNYGVPANKELAAQRGMMFRKDLVDKYDMDLSTIKTWADLEPLLEIIKENESEITPFYVSNDNGLLTSLNWDHLGGNKIPGVISKVGDSTTVLNEVETPEFKEAAELSRKWYQAGYINKDAATTTVKASELMAAGKLFSYTSALKPGAAAESSANAGYELVQVELTPATITTGDAQGAMLAISRTSKDPERAMMLLNLLHKNKDLVNLIVFGIEGEHYEKVSDNVIDRFFGGTVERAEHGYLPGNNWMIGSQFLNYLNTNEDPEKWEKFKQFNEEGTPSPALGFTFDVEPVKNEVAAVANVIDEFWQGINAGVVDPDETIAKYADKLKSVGADKIIEEKQKQLDEWLKVK